MMKMKFNNLMKFAALFAFLNLSALAGDLIHGLILDQDGYPLAGVDMALEDEAGGIWYTTSDSTGYYQFANLTTGWYYVHPVLNGLDVLNQACAFEYGFVGEGGTLDASFVINALNGVAVDFGTVSPSGFNDPALALNGTTFDMALQISNVGSLALTPDRLVIEGYWHVPGEGLLEATVVSAQISGTYAGTLAQVAYGNAGNYAAQLEITRGWPGLNLNGEVAEVTFGISNAGLNRLRNAHDTAVFCVQYAMYTGNILVAEGSTNWNGTIQ